MRGIFSIEKSVTKLLGANQLLSVAVREQGWDTACLLRAHAARRARASLCPCVPVRMEQGPRVSPKGDSVSMRDSQQVVGFGGQLGGTRLWIASKP